MIKIDNILDCEKHLKDIKTVIFDLDDTLYSEKEYVRSGYASLSKLFPQIPNMADKLWDAFCSKKKAFNEVLENEGCFSEQNLKKCIDAYRNHLPDIHLYDGVYEMLVRLKNNGKKIGLITDGRPNGQKAKIDSLGLDDLFDYIIITDELGGEIYRKPNPTAFIKMSCLSSTDLKAMAYIGDNITKDFKAPDMLGMTSVWFDNKDGLYSSD